MTNERELFGTVIYKRRGADCGVWCFSPQELEAAHRNAMEYAIQDLRELKDAEPLRYQVERQNPYFMEYPEARQIIGLALEGKGFKGPARPRTIENIERNRKICLALWLLKQSGLTIEGTTDSGTATELVAKRIHKSASRVYEIWRELGGEPKDRNLAPWEYLDIPAPSHDEILEYCLNGKFREHQRRELDLATIRYAISVNLSKSIGCDDSS